MSLKLNAFEPCPHGSTCPYNNQQGQNFCIGASEKRPGLFICDYVNDSGIIEEGKFRSKFDETGKMKIIIEQGK
jgi:hypothetical protein